MVATEETVRQSILLLAILTTACGAGGFDSGVQGDKPVSTVTDAEARQFCEALESWYFALAPVAYQQRERCELTALGTTANPAACEASVNACLQNPPAISDFDCTTSTALPGCNATVDEVEACAAADANALKARADEASCAAAGNLPELQRLAMAVPVPAECSRLASYCPVYGDGFFR